jgi:acetylornithine aminotransferase
MTLAKGLGNGLPIGACLARGEAARTFKPGNHGSTFGGNPLACVAALTTLDVIEQDGLVARAAQLGGRMRDALAAGLEGVPGVKEVRGKGLLLGIELDRPCGELVKRGFDAGLLINVTAENVVRLLPPLVITDAEAKQLVDGVIGLVRTFLQAAEPAVAAR